MNTRKTLTVALVLALVCALVFAGLWQYERHNHSDLEELCYEIADDAYIYLSSYYDGGIYRYDLFFGCARFYSFVDSYSMLTAKEYGERTANGVYLHRLQDVMFRAADLNAEQLGVLVDITEKLSQDIHDPDAYALVVVLYYMLGGEKISY